MKKIFTFFLAGVFCLSLHAQSNITISSSCSDTTYCNYSSDCSTVFIELAAFATTDCSMSNDLIFSYQIDLLDDGSNDFSGTSSTVAEEFPFGIHRINFTISDQCNTTEMCDYFFEVKDCKRPTPVCIFGIATTVIPTSGTVTVSATDFESGSSYDNCTDYSNLHFSFSTDINDTTLTIECDDIPSDFLYPITMYVTDEVGNSDFCSTFLLIQDPSGACPNTPIIFDLQTLNPNDELIEGVLYDVNGTIYSNPDILLANLNIGDIITPIKNENHLNGVTGYDLVLIDHHILNLQALHEPWKLLAADVNESNLITSLDKVIIKSVILQINTTFPSGKSWIFDPSSYPYDGTAGPITFLGIKLGDVNGTATPMFQSDEVDTRTFDGTLNLMTENQTFKSGETFTINTFANNFEQIIGGQLTIAFDPSILEFQKIVGNKSIKLDDESFGKTMVDDGFILGCWNTLKSKDLKQNDSFFEITFKAKKDGKLSDYLTINSKKINSEIYVENGTEIEFWNAELSFEDENYNSTFTISPNPFSEKTAFSFSLENAGQVDLEIFDTNGRLVFSQQKNMHAGENQIDIQKESFSTNGIYFYTIKTPHQIHSGKLILF